VGAWTLLGRLGCSVTIIRRSRAASRVTNVACCMAVFIPLACTGDGGQADAPTHTTLAGDAFDPTRQGPAAPVEGAAEGGTVTVLTSGSFPSRAWDPTAAYSGLGQALLSGLVTRSLTQYAYDPQQDAMVLVPDIATDLGTPNADFTEWTYTIRDGVRFEDGSEVTADDVAYGIKRSFDPKRFASVYGPASYSRDFFLDFTDGHTYNGPYEMGTGYAGVVVDGDTLTLKMERPFPDMPYWAAFPAIGPIPEDGSHPAEYYRHPLATGPYKFAGYSARRSQLTLVHNDEWDPATDPARHQYPARYVVRWDVPSETITATILGGVDDGATTLSSDSLSADEYQAQAASGLVTTGSGICTHFWGLDLRRIPDIRVRKAIGYAYPYGQTRPWGAVGVASGPAVPPESSVLPPGFPGRLDYDVLDTAPGGSDPVRARQLLDEAGYARGEFELRWPYIGTDAASKAAMNIVAKAMERAGFTVTPVPVPRGNKFGNWVYNPNAPINIRGFSWCADWLSGSEWLPPLFHSDGNQSGAFLHSKAVDAQIERIATLPIEQQPAAWGELDKTIMTDYYPAIVTEYSLVVMPHGPRIGGMNSDNTLDTPTFKDIYVIPPG
jgi:peptide/nickel transport system substrate-binding protein